MLRRSADEWEIIQTSVKDIAALVREGRPVMNVTECTGAAHETNAVIRIYGSVQILPAVLRCDLHVELLL